MPSRASMATWRTSSFERGMPRLSLGSARDEHPDGRHTCCKPHEHRTAPDHDQRETHTVDRRRFGQEAKYEPAPQKKDRAGAEQQQPTHFGSNALNWSSSSTATLSFCAFSSFVPAPGPATT